MTDEVPTPEEGYSSYDSNFQSNTSNSSNVITVEKSNRFAVVSIDGNDIRYWDGSKSHCWWMTIGNAKLFHNKPEAVVAAATCGGTAVRVKMEYTVERL